MSKETTNGKKLNNERREKFYNSNFVLEFDKKTRSTNSSIELSDKELLLKSYLLREEFTEDTLDAVIDRIIDSHRDFIFNKKVEKSKNKNAKGLIQRKTKRSFTSSEVIQIWQIKRVLASIYLYQNILICLEKKNGIFYLIKKEYVDGLTTFEQKKKQEK